MLSKLYNSDMLSRPSLKKSRQSVPNLSRGVSYIELFPCEIRTFIYCQRSTREYDLRQEVHGPLRPVMHLFLLVMLLEFGL
jgi:hypothetical protein